MVTQVARGISGNARAPSNGLLTPACAPMKSVVTDFINGPQIRPDRPDIHPLSILVTSGKAGLCAGHCRVFIEW